VRTRESLYCTSGGAVPQLHRLTAFINKCERNKDLQEIPD
jgi:hypothetical protein